MIKVSGIGKVKILDDQILVGAMSNELYPGHSGTSYVEISTGADFCKRYVSGTMPGCVIVMEYVEAVNGNS